MSDTALNFFLASGTDAERLAFVPDPATPAAGPDPTYVFLTTDTNSVWFWDFGGSDWIGPFSVDPGTAITALTGDVTATGPGSAVATIAALAVTTGKINTSAVTFAKIQNIATNSLIGRDTAGSGDPENILLNATLSMDGAGNLQREALTGDITASAGSNATTLANTAATPGAFNLLSATVDAKGRITASAEGIDDTTTSLTKAWSSEKTNTSITAAGTGGTNQPQLNGLVSGGSVINTTLLQFAAGSATYYIDGILYNALAQNVTLDAADPSNPRFDVIALDDSETLVKITGVAGANPSVPSIDPSTQLSLTIVSVPAGATTVPGVANEDIYDTGAVWTITTNGTTWNTASAAYPTLGATAIAASALTNGAWIRFNRGSGEVLIASDILNFEIQSAATWPNKRTLQIQWRDTNNAAVGSAVTFKTGTYGFNSSDITTAQLIAIPIGAFNLPASAVQYLQITDAGGAIGFGLNTIGIQSVGDVVVPPTPSGGITQLTGDVVAGPGTGAQAAIIPPGTVTLSQMANQADQTILGNNTGGVSAPVALSAGQVRTVLALGTAALQNTGTSGANIPFLNGGNTWGGLQDLSVGANITPATTPATTAVGYLGSPIDAGLDSGNVAPGLADGGKTWLHTDANARNFTIPANGTIAIPIGTILAIEQGPTAGVVSVIVTSDTLQWGSSTGTRSLAANAGCSIQKVQSTVWRIRGEGIT